jgi:hypothetical protein
MDLELIKTVGKIAGIGGLALGVLLILFREIIRKKIFPQLTKEQAYSLLKLIVICVFIVAIIGIIAWVYSLRVKPDVNTSIPKEKFSECANLKVKVFPKIPYYLTNTIANKKRDFLYYTLLTGTNNCKKKVTVKVKYFVINPDFAIIKATKKDNEEGSWQTTTVGPKETKTKDLRPTFEYLREPHTNEIIIVQYYILTMDDEIVWADTGELTVTPKELIYWDLEVPSGGKVPASFLLASLSAWWAVQDPALKARAQQCLERGGSASAQDWFKLCYADFFDRSLGSSAVKVNPYPESWPLAGKDETSKQRLCKPTEVVTGKVKEIHSLEAALLFAALVNNLPEKLSGLILWAVPDPREGDAGVKRFILSWSSDGKDWHALDLTDPNRTEFTANESQATALVRNLRESRGDIVNALREDGVFIEHGQFVMRGRQILAIDFAKAFQSFSIGALP